MSAPGFRAARLEMPDAEMERAFVEQWVICDGDEIIEVLGGRTHRDKRVAATIIQWLGTVAGQAFLGLALARAKQISAEVRS